MAPAFASRVPFFIAAALLAAGLADPLVESIANTGVFGGPYADNNHLCVVPTLILGTLAVLAIVAVRCIDTWRNAEYSAREWFVDVAKAVSKRSIVRDLPYVLGLQLVALFLLESGEQLAGGGRLLGGTAWLGGPIVFSLVTHALVGTACAFGLRAVMRAVVRTFAALVLEAIRFVWLAFAPDTSAQFHRNGRAAPCLRAQSPHVRQIGGRAPPLLPIPA